MDIIYRREILPELKSFSSSNDICFDLVLLLEVINMNAYVHCPVTTKIQLKSFYLMMFGQHF